MISCIMRFSGNGASFLSQVGAAAGGAKKKVDDVTAAMMRLRGAATMISGAFVAAMAAIDIFAVKSAASLQRTLIAIKNETGADPTKMGRFYNAAFSISNIMGVAPTEGARVLLDISRLTAGQLSTAQMQAIAPKIAGFASTVNFNRPDISVDDATKSGLQLIHLFRAYHPAQMNPLFDQVYRLSGLMAEGLPQAVRQMTYYEPLFKGLKISDSTSVAMMAMLDRSGFRNKSGTAVNAAMLEALGPLQLTSHAQAGKLGLLEKMGVFRGGKFAWNTADGGTNFIGMLAAVANWANALEKSGIARSSVLNTINGVFGRQGGRIMSLMADPQMIGILHDIIKYQSNPNVSLAVGEANRQGSLSYQAGRAWGNVQAVVTELAYRQLPALTHAFKALADAAHNAQTWLHGHRRAEGAIAGGLGLLTGVAALRFGGGLLYKGLDIMGAFAGMKGAGGATVGIGKKIFMVFDNIFTAGFAQRLAPTFVRLFGWLFRLIPAAGVDAIPVVGWIIAIVTAIASLPKLLTNLPNLMVTVFNWWNRNKYGIGYAIGVAFGTIARMLIDAIKFLWSAISASVRTLWSNLYLMLTPGGNAQLQTMMGAAWANAMKNIDPRKYPGFFAGIYQGTAQGAGYKDVQVHMGGQTFQIMVPPGTTQQQAKQIADQAMARMRSEIRRSGDTLVSPREPRIHSVGLVGASQGAW
jgi:hypothetical protein